MHMVAFRFRRFPVCGGSCLLRHRNQALKLSTIMHGMVLSGRGRVRPSVTYHHGCTHAARNERDGGSDATEGGGEVHGGNAEAEGANDESYPGSVPPQQPQAGRRT